MRNLHKTLLACAFSATLLLGGMNMNQVNALARTADITSPVLVYGRVTKDEGNRLHITNQSPEAVQEDIIITTSKDTTRILDAVTGYPVSFDSITDGDTVYAYIGPAMTLSLPPIANASMVLCNIPADYKVPEYIKITSLEFNQDKSIATLKAANNNSYTIPADAQILPYLTRNLVTVNDLTSGKTCLIWSDSTGKASKVVLFPEEDTAASQTGWKQENGSWYYYDENKSLHSGWLQDGDDWYYLNPETHAMHIGFLTLEGNTYFMMDDGRMLTTAHTFTPDSNGVLR